MARLRKGQKAKSTEARMSQRDASVKARLAELKRIVETRQIPEGFEHHTGKGKLAEWVDADLGITKLPLNSLKKNRKDWDDLLTFAKRIGEIAEGQRATLSTPLPAAESKRRKDASIKGYRSEIAALGDEIAGLRVAYDELHKFYKNIVRLNREQEAEFAMHRLRFKRIFEG